MKLDPDLI
jgi:RIO kinase 2